MNYTKSGIEEAGYIYKLQEPYLAGKWRTIGYFQTIHEARQRPYDDNPYYESQPGTYRIVRYGQVLETFKVA